MRIVSHFLWVTCQNRCACLGYSEPLISSLHPFKVGLFVAFSITLFIAVLLSGWAKETVISTAVLFVAAGLLTGSGLLPGTAMPSESAVRMFAEMALVAVLFTDGIRTGHISDWRSAWQLPSRALLIGMPLTIIATGLLAHFLMGVSWISSFLIAAALSPTDPVLVASVFEFEKVPVRIKRLLTVESGVNDGLALPIVLVLLSVSAKAPTHPLKITLELAGGVLLGIALPWAASRVQSLPVFRVSGVFERLNGLAIILLILGIAVMTSANLFLASFAGGFAFVTVSEAAAKAFQRFGETLAEIFKLAALLVFGAAIAPRLGIALSWQEIIFIVLATFGVRMITVTVSLLRADLRWKEILTAAWFGPKGFASVVYGLLILQVGRYREAHIIGIAVLASIVVYSSTDFIVGRWYAQRTGHPSPSEDQAAA